MAHAGVAAHTGGDRGWCTSRNGALAGARGGDDVDH